MLPYYLEILGMSTINSVLMQNSFRITFYKSDIENVLDDVIFIQNGHIRLHTSVDAIREQEGKSVDTLFREVFRC